MSLLSFSIDTITTLLEENPNAVLVDTRSKDSFSSGFIPGSIFIGLENKDFEKWATAVLEPQNEIILIAEKETDAREAFENLTNSGFKVLGFLSGGFKLWKENNFPIDMVINIDVDEFAMDIPFDPKMVILDVRGEEEFEESHVKDAINIPLDQLKEKEIIANFEEEDNHYIYCGGGYRSLIASSLFKKEGFHNLRNILEGFSGIKKMESIPLVTKKENK